MSELNYLVFQKIGSSDDSVPASHKRNDDDIDLGDQIDEAALDSYWDKVVKDIREDPDWYRFAGE